MEDNVNKKSGVEEVQGDELDRVLLPAGVQSEIEKKGTVGRSQSVLPGTRLVCLDAQIATTGREEERP